MGNDKIYEQIAELVKYHRKQSGLSQFQLANFAGTGKTAIFDIEHAKKTVKLDTLVRVLNVLNISMRFESPLIAQMEQDNA